MFYLTSNEFHSNSCKHCAPLFIIGEQAEMMPTVDDSNATLTFIKFQGRTYGITCKHVVEDLRNRIKEVEKSEDAFSYTFFIALKHRQIVQDCFVFPSGTLVSPEPDIAIRELHPGFPIHVGKLALDIGAHPIPPSSEVSFAVAAGFPDRLKTQNSVPLGYELTMPCVHAVAGTQPIHSHSFTLYSELQATPDIRDFSGMSGGPIYWSNETAYGLLGITYESSPLEGSNLPPASIYIKGHLADGETVERWVSHVPHLY